MDDIKTMTVTYESGEQNLYHGNFYELMKWKRDLEERAKIRELFPTFSQKPDKIVKFEIGEYIY